MLKDNDMDIVVMGCRGHMKVKQYRKNAQSVFLEFFSYSEKQNLLSLAFFSYLGSVSDVVLKDCKAAAIILKEIIDDEEVEHNPTGKAGMWPYSL